MREQFYYSATANGFYVSSIHGDRTRLVPDPKWVRPVKRVSVPDPSAKPGFIMSGLKKMLDPGWAAPTKIILMVDPEATAPFVEEANPNCVLPSDAVPISAGLHKELLDGQAGGKRIWPGKDGMPVLTDHPSPSSEVLWSELRRIRGRLLTASDWTQLPDVPSATRALWASHRQALRDLPANTADPIQAIWPVSPEGK